jgi:hypothetical protein
VHRDAGGKAMTDPVLQADLVALARLKPEVERLAGEVAHGGPGEIPVGASVEGAAAPSLPLPRKCPPGHSRQ